jgi:hypothetical protein
VGKPRLIDAAPVIKHDAAIWQRQRRSAPALAACDE